MGVILLIIVLGIVVIVHEWGHFFAAKKFGVRVDEFGIGFPPRAKVMFKKDETEYTLNWIPFGGFVKLHGENPDDPTAHDDKHRSLAEKPKWQQAIILVAGVVMNFLLAGVLFSIGFMSGIPSSISDGDTMAKDPHIIVVSVLKDSPASLAHIPAGARLNSIDGDKNVVESIAKTQSYVSKHSGKPIAVTYTLDNKTTTTEITPIANIADGKAGIGVGLDLVGTIKAPFFEAIGKGFATAARMVVLIAKFFVSFVGGLFTGSSNADSVAGPVGIAGLAGEAARQGFVYFLTFMGIISVNLAVLNLIPFPALDGGRLLFLLIEKIKGSKLNPKIAGITNTIGFALLIIMMLVVTYHDIVKLF